MSSFQLVSTLRRNVPVNLAFNNQERLENLCVRISSQIEPDTTKLLGAFRDSVFLKQNKFTKNNVIALFIPVLAKDERRAGMDPLTRVREQGPTKQEQKVMR